MQIDEMIRGPWPDKETVRFLLAGLAAGDCAQIENNLPDNVSLAAEWLIRRELGPLAYQRCQPYAGERTRRLAGQLAPIYWAGVGANSIKLELLDQLLAEFAVAGVTAVALKGIAFCHTIYPDPAVRPMNDLDFWIQKENVTAVWNLMHCLGYQTDDLWAGPDVIPDHITILTFYPCVPDEAPLDIEFHWDLFLEASMIGRLPLVDWWARTRIVDRLQVNKDKRSFHKPEESMSSGGALLSVRVLDPAAALLHACVHQMIKHRGELRLRWLFDIDQLIRGTASYHLTDGDWEILQEESLMAGVLPAVQQAIRITADSFSTPLPEAAVTLLAESIPPEQQALFRATAVPNKPPAARVWTELLDSPSKRQRWTILRNLFLPNPTYMRQRYHIKYGMLLPFYYIWRWLKAVWLTLRGMMRD